MNYKLTTRVLRVHHQLVLLQTNRTQTNGWPTADRKCLLIFVGKRLYQAGDYPD